MGRNLVALAACAAACGGAAVVPNRAALEQVEQARAEAHARPGARQAITYAGAVRDARQAGAYRENPAELTARTQDALGLLEAVAPQSGDDQAVVVAWQGLLLGDLGRGDDSWVAFQKSMQLHPNLVAARNIVSIWSQAGKPTKVGITCARMVVSLQDADELYDFIEYCRDHMNAVSVEASLAWATPDVRAFWEQERSRREREAVAEKKARAARALKEQRVVRDTENCSAQCKSRGHSCLSHCGGDPACENKCVDDGNACVRVCESRAYKQLGY